MIACADVRALAAEAALDLLSGGERAEVLAHLDACDECREVVRDLSTVSDQLLLLAPEAEPPVGFEQHVLSQLSPVRARHRWPYVASAAAAVLLVLFGFLFGRASRDGPGIREAAMRTRSGAVVGDVYLRTEDPSWVFVSVPGWTDAAPDYSLRVTLADGSRADMPGGDLSAGRGAWGTALPAPSSEVREVALVGRDGKVWCSAQL